MKTIKYIFSLCLIALLINSCVTEDDNADFVETAVAPTNVMASFVVTQDNSGVVTITPTAQGAIGFNVFYGDATADPANLAQGENAIHTYAEGTYSVTVVAYGPPGLETSISQDLVVSFDPPTNLVVTAENDVAISKQVNVTASADNAISYTVDFGDGSALVSGNIGETVSYTYADAGLYTITVVAMGAAIETTEFVIADFEVTAIVQPLESAPTPPARASEDVKSIFSDAYTNIENTDFNPNWGQSTIFTAFDLNGDNMLQYTNLNYQGNNIGESVDASSMQTLHIDIWTPDATSIDIYPLPNGVQPADERFVTKTLVPNEWNSFEIPMEEFTSQGLPVNDLLQFKYVGSGTVFIDNLYFWKESTGPSPLVGTWKLAPVAGALEVGDGAGTVWWATSDADVITRDCYFDDQYIFNADGSFQNNLGAQTWIEPWQGMDPEGCGTPVAPHDGLSAATYTDDGSTITVNGLGAYLGLAKVHNTGEDGMPVDNTITYDYVLSADGNSLDITISGFNGGTEYWDYKLVKDATTTVSPLAGTWKVAAEAGSLEVGDGAGTVWWAIDDLGVAERGCYYDDEYVFGADGTFQNVLGADTWLETWQGVAADGCGAPVAPHDGLSSATYTNTGTTLTLNGTGAFLGIPKVHNTGENGMPVDDTITYDYVLSADGNTLDITISGFNGGTEYWYYKMVKQ
jgi:hypothetical protein